MTELPNNLIVQAAIVLQKGGLVAFPTETVYGLGADACNEQAVARIYQAKGRPSTNPLICHVRDLAQAKTFGVFSPLAQKIAEKFWPGPLTLVVPRRSDCRIPLMVSAGLEFLALRVPAHDLARRLLAQSNLAIAAPSANPSGYLSPTTAQHVRDALGDKVDLILDGGECVYGLESTILKVEGDWLELLRPGGLTVEEIEAEIGLPVHLSPNVGNDHAPQLAPGRLTSHYAPNIRVRLNATNVDDNEALLAFGPHPVRGGKVTKNLSLTGDLSEAAFNLFSFLHQLDQDGVTAIAVMPIPDHGLGRAINDRLQRAAAARS